MRTIARKKEFKQYWKSQNQHRIVFRIVVTACYVKEYSSLATLLHYNIRILSDHWRLMPNQRLK